jgi:class 3 adenylate cyclase
LAIGSGRRLDASVLFLDISDFSSRPSETDAEQTVLLNLLSLFFTEFIRVIEDFDGVVEKNTGDGLMAYFAAPAGGGATTEQTAVAAALTLFSAAHLLLAPVVEQSGLEPVRFRVCIDHGPVTLANIGAAQRFRGVVAIGAAANVASKMLSVAQPGDLLLGDRVVQGLPMAWRAEFVDLKSLDTGWVYRATDDPYPFWRYTGRWIAPPYD